MNREQERLNDTRTGISDWRQWGPYLSDRQWGTVREDYSPYGNAWEYLPHDHARSRAYRWGEDGIAGWSDSQQRLCLSVALWNGKDSILKERLFGLTGNEGNHGEDVKELYYYLDSTPTHSYAKMLYKYPQREYPYRQLVEENRLRGKDEPEFELLDSGAFNESRYFDVFVEYAKAGSEDILMRVTAHNRGPDEATIHILPQIWFRNLWSWDNDTVRPQIKLGRDNGLELNHQELGEWRLNCDDSSEWLFCDNDTNARRLFGLDARGYFKDGINDYVVNGDHQSINPERCGTKAAAHYRRTVAAGASSEVRLRLTLGRSTPNFDDFESIFTARRDEADEFYARLQSSIKDHDARLVQRQALAGMLWSKQYYYFDVRRWLEGDPTQPIPPAGRLNGRNREWAHLNNADIISMPDKWEYPWFAAWDLAFHCVPLAIVDPDFAKSQLLLLTREWYMHPNGQLPAYEWAFGDVNPPVHAWAAWRVYEVGKKADDGVGDHAFLERVFQKLLLNFTWWVNKKDSEGNNLFSGGFLGLDNIGVFDRSSMLPTGGHLEQSDGTSWMAMYCLNMMRIAIELAMKNPVYEDLATKFFEHFLYVAGSMANIHGGEVSLWDEDDQFFYDVLHTPDSRAVPLRVRSMVGLIPLFAVETLEPQVLDALPEFKKRLEWFLMNRPDLAKLVSRWHEAGVGEKRLLSLLRGHRMKKILKRMLDETEFLSDYGIRALSRVHLDRPYHFGVNGMDFSVSYQPGESNSALFGGNSNWRGPIWMPVNYLIIESLHKFHHYYGDDFRVECPTGSGQLCTIKEIAAELSRRLARLFIRDEDGRRAVFGDNDILQNDPYFRDYVLFHEYFHGDTGRGVGASHQTGWTGLIAELLRTHEHNPHRKDNSIHEVKEPTPGLGA